MAKTMGELFMAAQKKHFEATRLNSQELLREVFDEYNTCLNMAPDEPALIFCTGSVMAQMGLNGAAINMLRRASERMPGQHEIWCNLGSAYKAEFMHEEAKECWDKAAAIAPNMADYQLNLSTLYINEGCPQDGLVYANKAVELDPANEKAHWNRALLLLELGRWKEGFIDYDAGLISRDRQYRVFDNADRIPNWEGQKLTQDDVIVVYGEQGLGDEIMYASCIPDLIATGAKVIYECHPRLEGIMRRSFPGLHAIYPTRKARTIEWTENHPDITYKVAIGSLFRWFRSEGQFPRTAYLVPDHDLVDVYRMALHEAGPGPYVGFGWAGGTKRTHGAARSLQLTPMLPVLQQPATFISLQYTKEADEKVARFVSGHGIDLHHWPDILRHHDYDHTFALLAALDLVIAINTTAVHACGAIGQECWTVTPDRCAWRYAQGGDHMVMYGDWVTQYRENGDMGQVIEDLAHDLKERYLWAHHLEVQS